MKERESERERERERKRERERERRKGQRESVKDMGWVFDPILAIMVRFSKC